MTSVVNASLAGGVIIGTYSNLEGSHYWAIPIGLVGGSFSTYGFNTLYNLFWEKLGLHDTCGVCHLHALPGVLGTIIGVIAAATAGEEAYGEDISVIFPAREWRTAG